MITVDRADVKFLRRELLRQIHQANGNPITLEELAGALECGYQTVLRHRKALEQAGYISVQRRQGRDTGGSIYELSPEAVHYFQSISVSR